MKKQNKFSNLSKCDDLIDYFNAQACTNTQYCHYTKISTIEKILDKSSFRLSCVSDFNDECDKRQFGDDKAKKYFYALCLSRSKSENLALWYLYSGMDGQGGRICFSFYHIKRIIEESTYELFEFDTTKKEVVGLGMNLEKGITMDLRFQDVVYFQNQNKYVHLKYNIWTNRDKILREDFEKYKMLNMGFCKNTIWCYEKESRLLVELKGKAREKIDLNIDNNKNYVIVMTFPKTFQYNWMNIQFAPEIDENIYWDILNRNPKIRKFMEETSHLTKSNHVGEIKMHLCEKCEYKEKKESGSSKKN